jgi:hypothetical protein
VATRNPSYMLDAFVAVRPLVEAAFDHVDETAGRLKGCQSAVLGAGYVRRPS